MKAYEGFKMEGKFVILGELRKPKKGDFYLSPSLDFDLVLIAPWDFDSTQIIMKKVD